MGDPSKTWKQWWEEAAEKSRSLGVYRFLRVGARRKLRSVDFSQGDSMRVSGGGLMEETIPGWVDGSSQG